MSLKDEYSRKSDKYILKSRGRKTVIKYSYYFSLIYKKHFFFMMNFIKLKVFNNLEG